MSFMIPLPAATPRAFDFARKGGEPEGRRKVSAGIYFGYIYSFKNALYAAVTNKTKHADR